MQSGYLYIITNKSWPEWTKVGVTKNLKNRLHTYQTGSPFRDYVIVYSIHHPNYLIAEKQIREIMTHFATEIKNEWYRIDLAMAKSKLDEVLECYD